MITVRVKHENGKMIIDAEGHALFNQGNDIVCAAVSIIMQTAVLGIQAIAEKYPENVEMIHFDTV